MQCVLFKKSKFALFPVKLRVMQCKNGSSNGIGNPYAFSMNLEEDLFHNHQKTNNYLIPNFHISENHCT